MSCTTKTEILISNEESGKLIAIALGLDYSKIEIRFLPSSVLVVHKSEKVIIK